MNIYINQKAFSFNHDITLNDALEAFKATPPFAILINGEFLPQSEHDSVQLKESDKVDVIGAIQGG